MSSLAVQRLESLLQTRKLDNTLADRPASAPAMLSSGFELLDRQLGGGWPQGEVSELIGRQSSGCSGVLLATMAAATRRGGLVGLVDTFDRFDPVMAARSGLDLDRVLWVRGPALSEAGEQANRRGGGCTRPLARLPASQLSHCAVLNGIRALDLILRAGGFAVAALDVLDAPSRAISALPFTTWLRLAHANEGRETVCLLMGAAAMGRSARGRSLRLAGERRWSGRHPRSRRFLGFTPTVDAV
jgi:hypothetical protein